MNRYTSKVPLPLYQKRQSRYPLYFSSPFLANAFFLLLVTFLVWGFSYYVKECSSPLKDHVEIDLSLWHLPKYTFFSLCRGLIAYFFSLCFSITLGYIAAKDKLAEKILIPLIDVLQSVPILGFMPGLFILCISLFPSIDLGLELTSILMIFTSQTWNMTFSVYHSLRTIPKEKQDCATLFSFSNLQRFRWLELPSSAISLIWNSVMSMAGGWFFLMASEAFILKGHDYRVLGLGSYMSVAAGKGDVTAMTFAVLAMIALIVFLDQFLWSPLISWAGKFRLESNTSEISHFSWFYELLKKTSFSQLKSKLPSFSFNKHKIFSPVRKNLFFFFSRPFLICLLTSIITGITLIIYKIHQIPLDLWLHLGHMTLLTLSRVLFCLAISLAIALPLGMAIGLSKKAYSLLEPILQITASFPATLLFPFIIWLLHIFRISMNVGSILLMLTGSVWYIVFTTLAGVSAIPNDYKEVSKIFTLRSLQKIFSFYLPSIFPYLITGMISATGGAWNASIVAEYTSYKGGVFTVLGIGSTINLAAQNNDIVLLLASIIVMSSVVAIINYFVWLRLYHYSEKRFSLNT